jgi:hypothetical protein
MAKRKKQQDEKEEKKFPKPKLNLAPETKRGIIVVIFVGLALIVLLSLANFAGPFGQQLFRALTLAFGVLSYAVPLILLVVAVSLYNQDLEKTGRSSAFYWRTYLGATLLTGTVGGLIHMFFINPQTSAFTVAAGGGGGGYFGALFAQPSFNYLGFWAGSLLLFALIVISILITFDVSLKALWSSKPKDEEEEELESPKAAIPAVLKINSMGKEGFIKEQVLDKNPKVDDSDNIKTKPQTIQPTKVINAGKGDGIKMEAITLEDRKDWKLPNFDLLDDSQAEVDSGNIEVNVSIIKKTLSDLLRWKWARLMWGRR